MGAPFGVFSHELQCAWPLGLPAGVQSQRVNPPIRTVWLLGFIASLAVLSFGVWFQVSLAQHWTRPHTMPYGVKNPVLAMQMAKPPWPVEMLTPGQNMAEMTRQQYIDFGYIPSYTALFICIAILQWRSDRRWIAALAPVCFVLTLIAAGFDVAENFAILGVTERHNPTAWASIRPHSLVKWACAFLVILLQNPFYLSLTEGFATLRGWLAGILANVALIAGLFGFFSSIVGSGWGIEWATLGLLVSMLIMPPFLWLGSRAPGPGRFRISPPSRHQE